MPPQSGGQRVGAARFFRESWAELRKVQWPTSQQVVQGTIVVAVFTISFAIFLTVVDYGAVRLVRELDKLLT